MLMIRHPTVTSLRSVPRQCLDRIISLGGNYPEKILHQRDTPAASLPPGRPCGVGIISGGFQNPNRMPKWRPDNEMKPAGGATTTGGTATAGGAVTTGGAAMTCG